MTNVLMSTNHPEVQQAVSFLERIAEESNDANAVRGAYKLIRQIEEFVEQLPQGRTKSTVRLEGNDVQGATRKGKPGRKPGKMKKIPAKAKSDGVGIVGKRRGRKPKNVEVASDPEGAAE